MMPGSFRRPITKSFWGDLQLQSGASLHARIIGSYNGDLLDDLLAELGPLEPSDMIIVNFGAWYPAFAWQVGPNWASSKCSLSCNTAFKQWLTWTGLWELRLTIVHLHAFIQR